MATRRCSVSLLRPAASGHHLVPQSRAQRHLPQPGDYEIAARTVAAEIVGGDEQNIERRWFRIFARGIVPISGPIFASAAILRGLFMWNQYLWPIMVTQSEQYRPVMVGLGYFYQLSTSNTTGILPWGEVMAYLSIITIPVIILFLALQRAFIESIASTGIKG